MVRTISDSRTISSRFLTPFKKPRKKNYVKGFALDSEKIQKLVGATTDDDDRVDEMMFIIMMYFVDRDEQWLCDARRLDDETYVAVISLGEGSVSGDLEHLKQKDLPIPEYLTKQLSSALVGPDVFEFVQW